MWHIRLSSQCWNWWKGTPFWILYVKVASSSNTDVRMWGTRDLRHDQQRKCSSALAKIPYTHYSNFGECSLVLSLWWTLLWCTHCSILYIYIQGVFFKLCQKGSRSCEWLTCASLKSRVQIIARQLNRIKHVQVIIK